jgi:hypothetical protein
LSDVAEQHSGRCSVPSPCGWIALSITSFHRFRSQHGMTTRWENPHNELRGEIADA